jgi:hypothetical protein
MSGQLRRAHSFVIRMWIEPREVAGMAGDWRGEIQHVPSGQRTGFDGLGSITEKIRQMILEAEAS